MTADGAVIVLGSAACVWDDLEAAQRVLGASAPVVAVNAMGAEYSGPLAAWGTLHFEKLAHWHAERACAQYPMPERLISQRWRPGMPAVQILIGRWPGSSGLYGVQIALDVLKARRVVCCGIPMTETAHFDTPDPWRDAGKYRGGWKLARGLLAPHVRSMSGWTRDILGEPTRGWLESPVPSWAQTLGGTDGADC